MASGYVPGACNIGPAEIRQRARAGYAALAVTAAVSAVLIATDAPASLRVLASFPATAAALCFFQAAFHFCAAFGLAGLYNVVAPAGTTETVQQAEFRAADRKKALVIIAYSVLAGAAFAAVLRAI